MRQLTFAKAMLEFFGKKPGQGLADFQKELAELDGNDKRYFAELFKTVDIEIIGLPA